MEVDSDHDTGGQMRTKEQLFLAVVVLFSLYVGAAIIKYFDLFVR